MIKWTGKSTDGRWNKTVEADSYFELLEKLVDKGILEIISTATLNYFMNLVMYLKRFQN